LWGGRDRDQATVIASMLREEKKNRFTRIFSVLGEKKRKGGGTLFEAPIFMPYKMGGKGGGGDNKLSKLLAYRKTIFYGCALELKRGRKVKGVDKRFYE